MAVDIIGWRGATILGTFLGWFLGKPKNKPLSIQVASFAEPVESRNGEGFYGGALKDGELDSISFRVNFVFYNPSDRIKVIRNIRIEFFNNKHQLLFSCLLLDLDKPQKIGGFAFAGEVPAMNVLPGYAVIFKGEYFINHEDLQKKDEIDKCILAYDDEKMKKQALSLRTFDFKSIVLIKAKETKK